MSYNPNDPNTWQTPPPPRQGPHGPGYPYGQPNYPNYPPPGGYQQVPPGGYQPYPPPGYYPPPGGYQPYSNAFGMPTDLPQAGSAQVCGIIGLILFFSILGLIFDIIAMVQGTNAMRLYEQNPGRYTDTSYRKAKNGRTCGIVGASILGFFILIIIIALAANA